MKYKISVEFPRFFIFFFSLFDGVLLDALLADETDVSHVPEVLVEVEGVPDHKLVRDLEGNVVRGVTVTLSDQNKIKCSFKTVN